MGTAIAGFDLVPSTGAAVRGGARTGGRALAGDKAAERARGAAERRYDYVFDRLPAFAGTPDSQRAYRGNAGCSCRSRPSSWRSKAWPSLKQTVEAVRAALNPRLAYAGILLTMSDRRNRLSVEVEADVRGHPEFGRLVYDTIIPRNVRVSEAPSHGKPVIVYDMQASGSQAYIRFAGEFLRREEGAR